MLNLKIPPAVVTLLFASVMWVIGNYFHFDWSDFSGSWWGLVFFFTAGGAFGLSGIVQFYKESTSINPHKPDHASSLVNDGIYGISRNPMYVALLLLLISYGFYLDNILTFIILPLFILYINYFQIIPEEEVLERKFGKDFEEYKSRVRRWI